MLVVTPDAADADWLSTTSAIRKVDGAARALPTTSAKSVRDTQTSLASCCGIGAAEVADDNCRFGVQRMRSDENEKLKTEAGARFFGAAGRPGGEKILDI